MVVIKPKQLVREMPIQPSWIIKDGYAANKNRIRREYSMWCTVGEGTP